MPDLKPDVDRQATAVIRGFAYQCYQTIRAWLQCGPTEELRCEFAEDFDLVRRDLADQVTDAELNQVKHEKGNITLNSASVTQLINNLFRHKSRNPTIKLTVRLCAISDRGKESQVDWFYVPCGMDLWDELRSRRLAGADQNIAVSALRSHLQMNGQLSPEVQKFLSNSDNSKFLSEFVDVIFWDTGQPSFTEIQEDINRILARRERPISDPLESEQTINRLWRHVMNVLASDSDRTLTRAELEQMLAQETTVRVDRARLEQIAKGVSDTSEIVANLITQLAHKELGTAEPLYIGYEQVMLEDQLPPLPAVCSPRTTVLAEIRVKCEKKRLIWTYGSTGYGKTTIANLLVRDAGTKCLWFRLRNFVDFELTSCLGIVLNKVGGLQPCESVIVVLDDLELADGNTTNIELLGEIVESIKNKAMEALVIVASQGFAPSRVSALLGDQLTTFDMPSMTSDEITELIKNLGLPDKEMLGFWTAFIEARTKGHPQLVGAYLTDAKESEWKFSAEKFATTPETAESIKRESRKLLVEPIPSAEARELAKRLSVVNISFRRDFALAVARIKPPLTEPGHAFDSLLGPWIEIMDSDHYCLSPLLEGYAASEVGPSGLTSYYRMTAYAWFLQKKFNQTEFIQFVTAALLAKEEFLLADIGRYLLSVKEETLQLMAKEISLICLFGISDAPALRELPPLTRCWFRMGLLRIAARTGQTETYAKLDAAILADLEPHQAEALYKTLLFIRYVQTSIERTCPLPMKERIRRVIEVIKCFQNGLLDGEDFAGLDFQSKIETLLMIVTSELRTKEDLEYLLQTLSQQSAEVVGLAFSGFQKLPDMLPLLLDRVWVAEANKETPEWDSCKILFSKIADFAYEHKIRWLIAGAARAKMVISDEYFNDSESALEIGRAAREKLRDTHPVIDLAEATVRYRREEYTEFLTLFDKVDGTSSSELLILEKLFGLRRAIIACSHTQLWDKILHYANRGIGLAKSLSDGNFARIATIAFHAEKAWAEHEKGNRVAASEQFETSLKLAESFPEQGQPLFHAVRFRLGAALGWLAYHSARGNDTSPQPAVVRPFCGMFADLEEPSIEILNKQVAPYQNFWAMLADYAAWYAPRERVKSFASQALKSESRGQSYLAVWSAGQALFANDLAQKDFDAALISGLDYLRVQTIGSVLRQEGNLAVISGFGDLESVQLSAAHKNEWAATVSSLVFEPILMTICSTGKPLSIDIEKWRSTLHGIFDSNEVLFNNLKWIDIGLSATNGDEAATTEAKSTAQQPAEQNLGTQRLAQIICCASKALSPLDCISAQAFILLSMPPVLYRAVVGQAFTRMAARRWIHLATEQKFFLSAPMLYGSRILEAASQTVPTISECANLLLLVAEATRLTWPQPMLLRLKELKEP